MIISDQLKIVGQLKKSLHASYNTYSLQQNLGVSFYTLCEKGEAKMLSILLHTNYENIPVTLGNTYYACRPITIHHKNKLT